MTYFKQNMHLKEKTNFRQGPENKLQKKKCFSKFEHQSTPTKNFIMLGVWWAVPRKSVIHLCKFLKCECTTLE